MQKCEGCFVEKDTEKKGFFEKLLSNARLEVDIKKRVCYNNKNRKVNVMKYMRNGMQLDTAMGSGTAKAIFGISCFPFEDKYFNFSKKD